MEARAEGPVPGRSRTDTGSPARADIASGCHLPLQVRHVEQDPYRLTQQQLALSAPACQPDDAPPRQQLVGPSAGPGATGAAGPQPAGGTGGGGGGGMPIAILGAAAGGGAVLLAAAVGIGCWLCRRRRRRRREEAAAAVVETLSQPSADSFKSVTVL